MQKIEYLYHLTMSDEFNVLSDRARLLVIYALAQSEEGWVYNFQSLSDTLGVTKSDISDIFGYGYMEQNTKYEHILGQYVRDKGVG